MASSMLRKYCMVAVSGDEQKLEVSCAASVLCVLMIKRSSATAVRLRSLSHTVSVRRCPISSSETLEAHAEKFEMLLKC